jgi:hypothetical protein
MKKFFKGHMVSRRGDERILETMWLGEEVINMYVCVCVYVHVRVCVCVCGGVIHKVGRRHDGERPVTGQRSPQLEPLLVPYQISSQVQLYFHAIK